MQANCYARRGADRALCRNAIGQNASQVSFDRSSTPERDCHDRTPDNRRVHLRTAAIVGKSDGRAFGATGRQGSDYAFCMRRLAMIGPLRRGTQSGQKQSLEAFRQATASTDGGSSPTAALRLFSRRQKVHGALYDAVAQLEECLRGLVRRIGMGWSLTRGAV